MEKRYLTTIRNILLAVIFDHRLLVNRLQTYPHKYKWPTTQWTPKNHYQRWNDPQASWSRFSQSPIEPESERTTSFSVGGVGHIPHEILGKRVCSHQSKKQNWVTVSAECLTKIQHNLKESKQRLFPIPKPEKITGRKKTSYFFDGLKRVEHRKMEEVEIKWQPWKYSQFNKSVPNSIM